MFVGVQNIFHNCPFSQVQKRLRWFKSKKNRTLLIYSFTFNQKRNKPVWVFLDSGKVTHKFRVIIFIRCSTQFESIVQDDCEFAILIKIVELNSNEFCNNAF